MISFPSYLQAIKRFYAGGSAVAEESQVLMEAAKEREALARPKEASFYKKVLTDWDVAQKLFKKEMDEYDKAQQAKKGTSHAIRYRTAHAREWFNNMSQEQKKEVEDAKKKWNEEGALEEIQAK